MGLRVVRVVATLLVALAACDKPPEPSAEDRRAALPSAAFVEDERAVFLLRSLIERHGSVVFRSRSGKWRGSDSDADLQLKPDGAAKLILYGVGVVTQRGRWSADSQGVVRLDLVEPVPGWPELILGAGGDVLQLRPKDLRGAFQMGDEFWPFRSLAASDRKRFHD